MRVLVVRHVRRLGCRLEQRFTGREGVGHCGGRFVVDVIRAAETREDDLADATPETRLLARDRAGLRGKGRRRNRAHPGDQTLGEDDEHALTHLRPVHLRGRRGLDGERVQLPRARDPQGAGLGAPRAHVGRWIRVARHGAQVHDVARLELHGVEREHAREAPVRRAAQGRTTDDGGAESERLPRARADDDLEPCRREPDVVASDGRETQHTGRLHDHRIAGRELEDDVWRRVGARLECDHPRAGVPLEAQDRGTRGHGGPERASLG